MKPAFLLAIAGPIRGWRYARRFLAAALVTGAVAGCASLTEPASASFASVVIRGRSLEEIAAATGEVFA